MGNSTAWAPPAPDALGHDDSVGDLGSDVDWDFEFDPGFFKSKSSLLIENNESLEFMCTYLISEK